MEDAEKSPSQTDRFLFWGAFLLLLATVLLVVSSVREEEAKLAGLRKVESDREAALAAADKARDQGTRYLDRFSSDPEFVRDQARERLGVASPDEVVIRVESGAGAGHPSAPLFAPATPAPAATPASR